MLTKKQILERGWTETLIKKFIKIKPELEPNPIFKSAAPMQLYPDFYILHIENNNQEFKKEFEKAQVRKQKAKERADKKRQENIANLQEHLKSIKVKKVENVEKRAIDSKYSWYKETREDFYESRKYFKPDSDEVLKRWTVNYIRHNLTSYDSFVEKIFHQIGASEMYLIINQAIYEKITEVYPDYKDECERQKTEKEMQNDISFF